MRINVSGAGCVSSLGNNIEETAENLFGCNSKPSFVKERFHTPRADKYPVFKVLPETLSQKKDDESYSYLFLRKAAEEALLNAGLDSEYLKTVRVGVCVGTSVDVAFNCFDFYKDWKSGRHQTLEPLQKYICYSPAEELLKNLGLRGIAQTVVTACASGTDAIGIGAEWIENSLCDIVIAGGCDELNLIPYTGFINLMISSRDLCRPFDKNRNGINLGEGAGVFVLESERSLEKRRGNKYGLLLGYGNACDGYHSTTPHPEGRGLKKALNYAVNQADISIDKIAFINAHATGTPDNDAAEARVFSSCYGDIPVTATKGLTGHALGAAGAIEACLTLISLNECKIPKTHNFESPDETLGFIPVNEITQISDGKAAVSNSLAFGGCNAALVLGGRNYE